MPTDNSNDNKGGSGNSGSGNSGSNDGGSSNSGSTGNGATGAGSSTGDLTKGLLGLRDDGPKDIRLSTDTKQKYVKIIQDFRITLQDELSNMSGMPSIGNPGTFNSATNTKLFLQNDANGFDGVLPSTAKLIEYLEAFEAAVNKAADNLLHKG
jgi:hypothetical protein